MEPPAGVGPCFFCCFAANYDLEYESNPHDVVHAENVLEILVFELLFEDKIFALVSLLRLFDCHFLSVH